jgi:hypothetical protein
MGYSEKFETGEIIKRVAFLISRILGIGGYRPLGWGDTHPRMLLRVVKGDQKGHYGSILVCSHSCRLPM